MRTTTVTARATVRGELLEGTVTITVLDPPARAVLASAGTAIHDVPRFGLAAHDYVGWTQDPDPAAAFKNVKMHLAGSNIDAPGEWVKIAQGQYDTLIRHYFASMRAQGGLWTFGHEPRFTQGTTSDQATTQAEYRAAWERIIDVGEASGGPGAALYGTVILASAYRQGVAKGWWPNRPVGFYGLDGYADSTRLTADLVVKEFEAALPAGAKKAIFETSIRNGTDAQQVAYLTSLDAELKGDPAWVGCATWEGDQSGFDTTFRAPALAKFQQMALDPFYSHGGS